MPSRFRCPVKHSMALRRPPTEVTFSCQVSTPRSAESIITTSRDKGEKRSWTATQDWDAQNSRWMLLWSNFSWLMSGEQIKFTDKNWNAPNVPTCGNREQRRSKTLSSVSRWRCLLACHQYRSQNQCNAMLDSIKGDWKCMSGKIGKGRKCKGGKYRSGNIGNSQEAGILKRNNRRQGTDQREWCVQS